jgi:hypothetical protein
MEEDSDRQIDAGEVNRMAQEFDRQVNQDIPEYSPESSEATGSEEESQLPSGVLRDPPDRQLEERAWPPPLDTPASIGGGPNEIQALREEEQR